MKPARFDEERQVWVQEIPKKEWYTVRDVCTLLNSGGPSIRNSINRGTMKGHRVGGQVHVKHENLLKYIARRGAIALTDDDFLIEEIIPAAKDAKAVLASLTRDSGITGPEALATAESFLSSTGSEG